MNEERDLEGLSALGSSPVARYLWVAFDVYLIASGPHAYLIATDDRDFADELAEALP